LRICFVLAAKASIVVNIRDITFSEYPCTDELWKAIKRIIQRLCDTVANVLYNEIHKSYPKTSKDVSTPALDLLDAIAGAHTFDTLG
jgi:hypothetical protein